MRVLHYSSAAATKTNSSQISDEIRNNSYSRLFRPDCLIAGKEDAANNFGRGMYTIGREVAHSLYDAVRTQAETCTSLGGFFIFHSMAGGTGSGLSTLLLQELANEYSKHHKQELVVYPCPRVNILICILSGRKMAFFF